MEGKWNPAEFHHWYSRMPVERKRRAWDDMLPARRKSYIEWWTFGRFARVAPLDIDPRTIETCEPPQPDIRCRIFGASHYFELGEVTDQALAEEAGKAARQGGDVFGGSCSQLSPLRRILNQKCAKKYAANGRPLHLLLHYSVGHQSPNTALLQGEISRAHQAIVDSLEKGPFSYLWLYDGWDDGVIASVQR